MAPVTQILLIRNYSKKNSLYFLFNSQSEIGGEGSLNKAIAAIKQTEQTIERYEELLKKYKLRYEMLEKEVNR